MSVRTDLPVPAETSWPFQVGDRIHELEYDPMYSLDDGKTWVGGESHLSTNRPTATVTELTQHGFGYRYDERVLTTRPHYGWFEGGECFPNGYHMWTKIEDDPAADNDDTLHFLALLIHASQCL